MKKFSCIVLCLSAVASADSITIDGRTYDDVLVYETSRSYYVCLPEEGRALRASQDEVDPSTVTIISDAMYRTKLQTKYQQTISGGASGDANRSRTAAARPGSATVIEGSANNARPRTQQSAATSGSSAPQPSATATGGLGISLAQLQGGVQGAGMQFGESGSGQWVASAPQGNFTVNAAGAEDNLSSINVSASGSIAELQGLIQGMDQSLSTAVPWISEWIPEATQALMNGQPAVAERDGVRVQLSARQIDAGFQINAAVTAI